MPMLPPLACGVAAHPADDAPPQTRLYVGAQMRQHGAGVHGPRALPVRKRPRAAPRVRPLKSPPEFLPVVGRRAPCVDRQPLHASTTVDPTPCELRRGSRALLVRKLRDIIGDDASDDALSLLLTEAGDNVRLAASVFFEMESELPSESELVPADLPLAAPALTISPPDTAETSDAWSDDGAGVFTPLTRSKMQLGMHATSEQLPNTQLPDTHFTQVTAFSPTPSSEPLTPPSDCGADLFAELSSSFSGDWASKSSGNSDWSSISHDSRRVISTR